jgi:hypothetical protein
MRPTTDRISIILKSALDKLADGSEWIGVAYLKLISLDLTLSDEELAKKIRQHVEYLSRKDRRHIPITLEPAAPATKPSQQIEESEALGKLEPTDRAIVAMLIAGHTQAEAAAAQQLSPATVSRRVDRLRNSFEVKQ